MAPSWAFPRLPAWLGAKEKGGAVRKVEIPQTRKSPKCNRGNYFGF